MTSDVEEEGEEGGVGISLLWELEARDLHHVTERVLACLSSTSLQSLALAGHSSRRLVAASRTAAATLAAHRAWTAATGHTETLLDCDGLVTCLATSLNTIAVGVLARNSTILLWDRSSLEIKAGKGCISI